MPENGAVLSVENGIFPIDTRQFHAYGSIAFVIFVPVPECIGGAVIGKNGALCRQSRGDSRGQNPQQAVHIVVKIIGILRPGRSDYSFQNRFSVWIEKRDSPVSVFVLVFDETVGAGGSRNDIDPYAVGAGDRYKRENFVIAACAVIKSVFIKGNSTSVMLPFDRYGAALGRKFVFERPRPSSVRGELRASYEIAVISADRHGVELGTFSTQGVEIDKIDKVGSVGGETFTEGLPEAPGRIEETNLGDGVVVGG